MRIEGGQVEQEFEGLGQRGPAKGRQGIAGWSSAHLFRCIVDILRAVSSNLPDDLFEGNAAYLKYLVSQREVVEKIVEFVGGVVC